MICHLGCVFMQRHFQLFKPVEWEQICDKWLEDQPIVNVLLVLLATGNSFTHERWWRGNLSTVLVSINLTLSAKTGLCVKMEWCFKEPPVRCETSVWLLLFALDHMELNMSWLLSCSTSRPKWTDDWDDDDYYYEQI